MGAGSLDERKVDCESLALIERQDQTRLLVSSNLELLNVKRRDVIAVEADIVGLIASGDVVDGVVGNVVDLVPGGDDRGEVDGTLGVDGLVAEQSAYQRPATVLEGDGSRYSHLARKGWLAFGVWVRVAQSQAARQTGFSGHSCNTSAKAVFLDRRLGHALPEQALGRNDVRAICNVALDQIVRHDGVANDALLLDNLVVEPAGKTVLEKLELPVEQIPERAGRVREDVEVDEKVVEGGDWVGGADARDDTSF